MPKRVCPICNGNHQIIVKDGDIYIDSCAGFVRVVDFDRACVHARYEIRIMEND